MYVVPAIYFTTTTAGDTSSAPLVLHNYQNEAVTLGVPSLPSSSFFFNSSFGDSLLGGITIPADSSVAGRVYFNPLTGDEISQKLYFTNVISGDTVSTTELNGKGRAISFSWSNSGNYPSRILAAGSTLTVEETMDDLVETDSLVLFYAQGGSPFYQTKKFDLQVEDPLNDVYTVSIPSSAGGSRGIQFYIQAHNGPAISYNPQPEHPVQFRVEVENLSFSAQHPTLKYKMISIPIDIPQNTIVGVLEDNLGARNPDQWRMFFYTSAGARYLEVPSGEISAFEQGRAYWLITSKSILLDTAPQTAITTVTDIAFSLLLEPGWNMIGNPYNFRTSWDSILVDTIGPGLMAMPDVEGVIVERPVEWIVGQGYQYDIDLLNPFDGYWVKNLKNTNVILRIPPREAQVNVPAEDNHFLLKPSQDSDRTDDWRIQIIVSSQDVKDTYNFIGVTGEASNYQDRYDRSEPPSNPGRSISLYFPHSSWPINPGNYTADMRGTYEEMSVGALSSALYVNESMWGHIWQFDVAKNFSEQAGGDDVSLEFIGVDNVPDDATVYLIDKDLDRLIDLKKESQRYTFFQGKKPPVEKEKDARFIFLVGSEDFIEFEKDILPALPTETRLHQNYPNPFNPSTIIRYEVARPGRVTLRIYDVGGVEVIVLENRVQEPGRYEAGWNGENTNGQKVSSGVYFYRLRAGDRVLTKKMVLLK
jgi:hypothetical protein